MLEISNISLFEKRRPYYILAPDYQRQSAGTRVLHLLCHMLNRCGYEAYLSPCITAKELHTPILSKEVLASHKNTNADPITIYPEIVSGNPLSGTTIIRFILNHPGLIGGPTEFDDNEPFFFYKPEFASSFDKKEIDLLEVPIFDSSIFNNNNNPNDSQRTGFLIYPGRYSNATHEYPELFNSGTVITHEWPSCHEDLADLFRRSERLYCFTNSAIAVESVLCGCPVILLENEHTKQFILTNKFCPPDSRPPGIAIDTSIIELKRAQQSISKFISNHVAAESAFLAQLRNFIQITQNTEKNNSGKPSNSYFSNTIGTSELDLSYFHAHRKNQHTNWLNEHCAFVANKNWDLSISPRFQIVIRTSSGTNSQLADTLDSLLGQIHPFWHLDIISDQPAPDVIAEISCIRWHTLDNLQTAKETIDGLVNISNHGWIIELPPGAALDYLYLWRLAHEANETPTAAVFFVDDATRKEAGEWNNLRFKPGVNIEWLRSSDLAGPLCVRRDIWQAAGGASQRSGSPWFSQLLRIADQFGWSSVKHIPDVLINYPGGFPSDTQSCLLGLLEHLERRGIDGEIVPVTGQSWCLRYPLGQAPGVSIAILSQGHLDLLTRCLESIVETTDYADFEIVVVLQETQEDPDLAAWLGDIQQNPGPTIRTVRCAASDNQATRCNAAVQSSNHDWVLMIREEAVIIQEKWLEELVRTGFQQEIAAVSPCLVRPGSSLIENSGDVLGLNGIVGSPYAGEAKLGDNGYLDSLRLSRDVSSLPGACLLIRKSAYLAVGGMDESALGDYLADTDLCQKLRQSGLRLLYQPRATVAYGGPAWSAIGSDNASRAQAEIARAQAEKTFAQRWQPAASSDPFWNSNLSLSAASPTPETACHAQWQYLPSAAPRILARSLPNGQGVFRITSPLRALSKTGLASECDWPQIGQHEPSAAEILRLAPTTLIVQHYLYDAALAGLRACHAQPGRPFIVYTVDDLLTNMDESNPFRVNIPSDGRARLRYALQHADRLVTSTEFLADAYRHFISDIQVVPNRLEQGIWLPLQSHSRTGKKPRIGWAGGTTHQGDLVLLKEIIERTRAEADWVFFGMCPNDIRPLLAEYHNFQPFADYPAKLAALNLDIAVAPLALTPFNRGKSNLRLLEYGVLGIPVVCTDIDPYRNSPACLVPNTPDAWVAALRARIHDPEARQREGTAMRAWVHRDYLLEDHLEAWLAAHLPPK